MKWFALLLAAVPAFASPDALMVRPEGSFLGGWQGTRIGAEQFSNASGGMYFARSWIISQANDNPGLLLINQSSNVGAFITANNNGTLRIGNSPANFSVERSAVELRASALWSSVPVDLPEVTTPAAPGGNHARIFARDNGSGKTQLCVIFPTGAVQVLATQP